MTSPRDMGRSPPGFRRFQRRARALLRDPVATARLAEQAQERLQRRRGALEGVIDELATLTRLIRAWAQGEYREVGNGALVAVVAAVLYFVVPLDVIPDFLAGIGLVDDIAVVAWVLERVRAEVDAFRRWEDAQRAARCAERSACRGEARRQGHGGPEAASPHEQGGRQ